MPSGSMKRGVIGSVQGAETVADSESVACLQLEEVYHVKSDTDVPPRLETFLLQQRRFRGTDIEHE